MAMKVFVGLDIGGTKLMAADAGSGIRARTRRATPEGLEEGLAALDALVDAVRDGLEVAAIGIAIGGPLDPASGVVSPLHQPSWREVPLKRRLEARWRAPVFLEVDTNVAALGEYAADPERPSRLLYLTISTGMGGGFVVDGRIYRGAGGAHPEVAHQAVPYRCSAPGPIRCECGAPGCLEGLVSGNAIRRIYGRPAEELEDSVWSEIGYNLGQGLRNAAALYAPEVIAIGGGVAIGGGERLLGPAREVLRDGLRLVPVPTVRPSLLGYDTALVGALTLARRPELLGL